MDNKKKINKLWEEFRASITQAYLRKPAGSGFGNRPEGVECLRSYAEDIAMYDNLAALLKREMVNEKQHRRYDSPSRFPVVLASKLLLMSSAARGTKLADMPPASDFLIYRQTMVEAEIVGYLAQKYLSIDWREAVESIDYAKLMNPQGGN